MLPSPLLERLSFSQSIYLGDNLNSEFIIITDPIGESISIAEKIDSTWQIYSPI